MKWTVKITAAVLAVVLCGCASIIERCSSSRKSPYGCLPYPYWATAAVWDDCICAPWSGKTGPDKIWPTLATMTYPVWIVDEACEVVMDTVFLPADLVWQMAK